MSDCIDAVQSPQLSSLIDTKRTAIRGGSAGGYTTLAAISLDSSAASKAKFFASATNSYGVSNMELFAEDTHKFELMYIIKLLGGTKDEIPKVWHDRSPVYFSANIRTPLLVCLYVDEVRSDGVDRRFDRFFKAMMTQLFRLRNRGLLLKGFLNLRGMLRRISSMANNMGGAHQRRLRRRLSLRGNGTRRAW